MDFVIGLLIFMKQKRDNRDIILITVNCFIKRVYHEPVKTIIDIVGLAKMIIALIMRHHNFLKSIISD